MPSGLILFPLGVLHGLVFLLCGAEPAMLALGAELGFGGAFVGGQRLCAELARARRSPRPSLSVDQPAWA
jgi:hypothetical protein